MNHQIYTSNFIINNLSSFKEECNVAFDIFQKRYNTKNSTWDYKKYNIFTLTSSSLKFYSLFKELNYHIRSYIGDDRPLWMYAWLNCHTYKDTPEVLSFHGHDSKYHGYICIDPQDTTTTFRNGLSITNKPGQIYLGPGNNGNRSNDGYDHYVQNNSYYEGFRTTIGFNMEDIQNKVMDAPAIPLI